MLINPVLISIIVMMILCLLRCNVMLSILISALIAMFFGDIKGIKSAFFGDGNISNSISEAISTFIDGMSGNLETALSYILLGIIASAISRSNLMAFLINTISNFITNKKFIFIFSIAFLACFSQNLIPIHIAFIPILIPPLLGIMNKMQIDRRAVACALTFGLQTPYISLPIGFGLLFFTILQKEITKNGVNVNLQDISNTMILAMIPMILGLILAVFVYRKPRIYTQNSQKYENLSNLKMTKKEWGVLAGIIVAFFIQIYFKSLPLGSLLGIITMIIFGGIEYKKMDEIFDNGVHMMGFIAFVMLVASGYATILRESGGIGDLVNAIASISNNKTMTAILMLIIGLFVTMGIGTSFGTIPIIAAIYCPLAASVGFNEQAIIILVGIAAAVGDAGSPASDSTLGPTSGLNFDGCHNHIYDTCVPTFIFFNIPLIIFGTIFALWI